MPQYFFQTPPGSDNPYSYAPASQSHRSSPLVPGGFVPNSQPPVASRAEPWSNHYNITLHPELLQQHIQNPVGDNPLPIFDRIHFHGRTRHPQTLHISEEHTSELQSRVHLVCRLL